jgi:hypothetical protein
MSEDVFVQGQDQATAEKLLKAAEDVGLDPAVVRTSEDGFLVPEDVANAAYPEGVPAADEQSDEEQPSE